MRQGLEPAGRAVHMLPGFDEYLLGYSDRNAPLAGMHSTAIVPGGNGVFRPTVVIDGEVVSAWKRERRRSASWSPSTRSGRCPRAPIAAIAKALARYGEFLETERRADPEFRAPEGDRAR